MFQRFINMKGGLIKNTKKINKGKPTLTEEVEYKFSPSELDYKAKKCKRCFYIHKKYKVSDGGRPPPVFSSLDSNQKPYYQSINTKDWCEDLPDGTFMDKSDGLPPKITSEGLLDDKKRKFKLIGVPDIVIKLKEEGYAIYDFKTTNIKPHKAEDYRYQLEAYAQIFAKPGSLKSSTTPKLLPIKHMGIIQFEPSELISHNKKEHQMKFKVSYSPLKRDEIDFYNHITKLIDLIESPKTPKYSDDCSACQFTEINSNL